MCITPAWMHNAYHTPGLTQGRATEKHTDATNDATIVLNSSTFENARGIDCPCRFLFAITFWQVFNHDTCNLSARKTRKFRDGFKRSCNTVIGFNIQQGALIFQAIGMANECIFMKFHRVRNICNVPERKASVGTSAH